MQHSAGRQILAMSTFDRILAQQLAATVLGFLLDESLMHAVVELALMGDLAAV